MKEYLKKYGVRMGIVVAASAFLILVGAAARSGIGFVQNLTGIVAAPMQKVLSSTVNWFNSIYGYLYEYDALMAENESLRMQLAEAQQSAREGIHQTHDAGKEAPEKKSSQRNPYDVYHQRVLRPQPVQRHHGRNVCKPYLDPRQAYV